MKLYVMRHGPAQDDSPSGRDADRALTPSGRERVARGRKGARRRRRSAVLRPRARSSRAVETAEIVADVTHLSRRAREDKKAQRAGATGEIEIRRELGMGTEKLALLAELVRAGRKRVMIVGHEPDLSMLVMSLVGKELDAGMGKAMVVGVKLTADPRVAGLEFRSTLRFVLEPKTLTWQRD